MQKTTKWPVQLAVLASLGLLATTAWSGKPERDKLDELTPKVADAKSQIKAACGCDVAVNVKYDTYKSAGDMSGISNVLDSVKGAAKSHCVKPADKTALCTSLNTVEISLAGDSPSMEGKTLKAHCNAGQYNTQSDINRIFDKY
jgi:hypothetical protein